VCDGKMEEGSLRCEPNISIRREGSSSYGTKTELKNLASFRSVELGVTSEISRQTALIESRQTVAQETRGWNEEKEASYVMRTKETENDYRYFPDPDLAPLSIEDRRIEEIRGSLPELPLAKERRYRGELGLSAYDAGVLVADRRWAAFFDEAVASGGDPKSICNLMMSDFAKLLHEAGLNPEESQVRPKALVEVASLVKEGTISGKIAKELLSDMFKTGKMAAELVEEKGATQISDRDALAKVVGEVLGANPEVVERYGAGQLSVKGFLVGQVMHATRGRANPRMVQELVQEELDN